MKVTIIDASPRRGGIVSRMAEVISEAFPEGTEIETAVLSDLTLKPCIACMKCRTSGSCVFAGDDADLVGAKIASADVIVIATPTWWANMPGSLKVLFDRNVFRFMGESVAAIPVPLLKGRIGVILTACSTPFPFNYLAGQSSGLVRSIREIFTYAGIRLEGVAVCSGSKGLEGLPGNVVRRIRRIARKIANRKA